MKAEYDYETANGMTHSDVTHYRYIHDFLVGQDGDIPIVITECGPNGGSSQSFGRGNGKGHGMV